LERQPLQFLAGELMGHLLRARQALAEHVGAPADDLAFIQNATVGVNLVAPKAFGLLLPAKTTRQLANMQAGKMDQNGLCKCEFGKRIITSCI
jgi:hypothetical protein